MMQVGACREAGLESVDAPSKTAKARMRILVVDDDEAVRDSFALALAGLDCELLFAANGITAVDIVTQNEVGLVFLDLRMPGLDGVRTLRLLRQVRPETKICILSAFVEEHMGSLIDLASERLDFELFRKPLDIDEIRALTLTLAGPEAAYVPDESRAATPVASRKVRVLKPRAWRN
jgi:CheY-like chemotaxis protein